MNSYPLRVLWLEANARSDSGMMLIIGLAVLAVVGLLVVKARKPALLDRFALAGLAFLYIASAVMLLGGK